VRDAGPEKVPWILYPLALSATVMSLYACYQFYENPAFFVNRVTGFTGAFYRLSTLLVLSFPLVIILAVHSHGWMRSMIFLFIPFLMAALLFTFTRGAWIAVIVEAGILVGLFLKRFTKPFLGIIAAVFLTVMTLSYQSVISPSLITRGSEQPRIEAVRLSAEIIRKYPFTGIGYGKESFSKYYPDTYVKHAHNILLNTIVETGIIGGAVFVAMMAILLKTFIRGIREETVFEKKIILSGIFASFAGFLCLNAFDYMYHGWPGQIFWALIGIGLALIPGSSSEAH
jgi:O-antigen ligase